ncbi:hypothetical protein EVAR_95929_1 [Eumeta japonica]|uniref:Uncharacterized protein n=1 Tax=Eumeta variegata TaxID=151549 RepID=A0A4C1VB45_EUMVA|nr:hypothetical protein EVAR_95929_1 [Eumeta japonica]
MGDNSEVTEENILLDPEEEPECTNFLESHIFEQIEQTSSSLPILLKQQQKRRRRRSAVACAVGSVAAFQIMTAV